MQNELEVILPHWPLSVNIRHSRMENKVANLGVNDYLRRITGPARPGLRRVA
jgi:hypothetical protein